MPRTLRLGSSFAFNGTNLIKGRPPAKATNGHLRAGQGKLVGTWDLPADDRLSNVVGFYKLVNEGDDVEFPVGASPDESLSKLSKWQIEGLQLGQWVDAWVVTEDKYGTPAAPTADNALYLGRAKVVSTKKQGLSSGAFE